MDKEIKELLQQVLANQAIIFHRIDELYHHQIKSTKRAFYDEGRAKEELTEQAKKLRL